MNGEGTGMAGNRQAGRMRHGFRRLAVRFPVLLAGVLAVTPVQAGFTGPGQAGSPTQTAGLTTTARAGQLAAETWVEMEGQIIAMSGHEEYLFRDESGVITVEIDNEFRRVQGVSTGDWLHISGKVDREHNRVVVEVKSLRRLEK
ncbi:Uncharacterized conserved protein [Citrobacter freundii]|nr:Uncharacterized conserved protein [Citrobacter freundii]STB68598.1 Uncharacterized conserved protein [Citrobacter freundii]